MNIALPRGPSVRCPLRPAARRWHGPAGVKEAPGNVPGGCAGPVRATGHETCPSANKDAAAEAVSRQNFPGAALSPAHAA